MFFIMEYNKAMKYKKNIQCTSKNSSMDFHVKQLGFCSSTNDETRTKCVPSIFSASINRGVILLFFLCFSFASPLFAIPQYSKLRVLSEENTSSYTIVLEEMYKGLNQPWGMTEYTFRDSSNKQATTFVVTERNAKVWVMYGSVIKEIKGLPTDVEQRSSGGVGYPGWFDVEQGDTGFLYLSYAKKKGKAFVLSLVRFTLDEKDIQSPSKKEVQAKQLEEIFESNDPIETRKHFGGSIAISEQYGYDEVYLTVGDRFTRDRPQIKRLHTGNVVMISSNNLSVKILSYGHRNQQGLYFDKKRSLLYSTEHGPQGGDEINIIAEGNNYGWPIISHGKEYGSGRQVGEGTHKPGMEQPMYFWPISPAISGILGYYGSKFSSWNGKLLVCALKFEQLYLLTPTTDGREIVEVEPLFEYKYGRIRAVEEDMEGYIYLLTDEINGRMLRISKK